LHKASVCKVGSLADLLSSHTKLVCKSVEIFSVPIRRLKPTIG
jgi:hypothetical protein